MIERHPLKPFLPSNSRLLMLGSFPPSKKRWCMDFFYPNFNNDMWRIFGLIFFDNKDHFIDPQAHRFRRDAIISFLNTKGIALYDTACAVIRTKNTASDKDLQIVEATDIDTLLRQLPLCTAIAVTGQKAADILSANFGIAQPPVGGSVSFKYQNKTLLFFRMPSSSRAYPLALQKKAEKYAQMFTQLGILHDILKNIE